MDVEQFVLRMKVMVFNVLVLLHFLTILAAGIETQSQDCGDVHLGNSNVNGNTYIYINGDLVSKDLYCNIIRYHLPHNCAFESTLGSDFCQLGYESAKVNENQARKLLLKELTEEANGPDIPQKDKEDEQSTISTAQRVGIAATGTLSLCCIFLCPCFFRKNRATSHTVLEKDISMDSVSSAEAISVHDKVPPSPMRVPPSPSRFSSSPKISRLKSVHLSMGQVVKATNNFSPSLMIGDGGSGTVYKARLADGQVVAIKRAKKEHLRAEFSSEVELLAKIEHRNLVKLLGYVDKGPDRLIITEFVPNGTLREHLDGKRGKILDFNQRLEISIDVASALTYLHIYAEKQIIHRDVKSSNILLTESMRAKVADFGFARLGPMDTDHTHISTAVKGTIGYLDPEYIKTYQLTPKSDVHSFGILLLEILTGRRPVEIKKPPDERVTVKWAIEKYSEGLVAVLVDPRMEEPVTTDVLNKIFCLAFQCAAPIRSDRPDMKSVAEQLWGIRADYLRSAKKG